VKDSIRSAFQIIFALEAAAVLLLLLVFNIEKKENQSNNWARNQLLEEQQELALQTEQADELERQQAEQIDALEQQSDLIDELAQQAAWMDQHAAIIDDPYGYDNLNDYAGSYYHTYRCPDRPEAIAYWVLDPPHAESYGLLPCPNCY